MNNIKQGVLDPKLEITLKNGLLFIGKWLVILKYKNICKQLFRLAHNHLSHFGGEKSYASLKNKFYWLNMRRDLMNAYIPGCRPCQCNKSTMAKVLGPLHPLTIPDKRFDSVAINFVGPLPEDNGFDAIMTMMDRLGSDIQISLCRTNMTADEFTMIFFNQWYCKNGCPLEIISDCNKLFVSKFWKVLMKLAGVKHKLLTVYHPETDSALERTNKTVVQCLQFHVECNQKGWAKALPKVCFNIMNTVNALMEVTTSAAASS